MRRTRIIPLILALAIATPLTAGAQEKETADVTAAQRRVEEAQRQLRAALEELGSNRAESMNAANAALRKAVEELRSAQRDLRADEYADLAYRLRVVEPNINVFLTEGRPRMGVLLAETTQREAWDSLGAKLSAVTPGGPAEEAGLKAGDIIVTANGTALGRTDRRDESPNQKLVATINELKEGDVLQVDFLRDGKRASATVKVRELRSDSYAFSMFSPDSNQFRFDVARPNLAFTWEGPQEGRVFRGVAPNLISSYMPFQWFNMELVELDAGLGGYFGTTEGLLVVRAPDDDSFALKSGDVILSIDGRAPTSPAHALRIMRSYEPGESMTIDIMREKKRQAVTVTIPERGRGFFWEPDGK
jgi:S1-C subfamily serine protease